PGTAGGEHRLAWYGLQLLELVPGRLLGEEQTAVGHHGAADLRSQSGLQPVGVRADGPRDRHSTDDLIRVGPDEAVVSDEDVDEASQRPPPPGVLTNLQVPTVPFPQAGPPLPKGAGEEPPPTLEVLRGPLQPVGAERDLARHRDNRGLASAEQRLQLLPVQLERVDHTGILATAASDRPAMPSVPVHPIRPSVPWPVRSDPPSHGNHVVRQRPHRLTGSRRPPRRARSRPRPWRYRPHPPWIPAASGPYRRGSWHW